ncbi:hypothetical protein D9613_001061 [Agrocybe pediades]|uniref:Uncharacterized protein n=1 Tax=Agrocybe pediades TaxID=84607 RepID=A0A8H4VRL0_9AGAR|nr:hypothetical protein D9613_001061 [Agrocybe pediades]
MNNTYSVYNAPTQDWITILKIACEHHFKEVKNFAIRQLEQCNLSVVSRLTIYQLYKVDLAFILPLLYELCIREEGPTDQETEEMGIKTSLIIFRIRERLRAGANGPMSPVAAGTGEAEVMQAIYAVLGVDSSLLNARASPTSPNSGSGATGAIIATTHHKNGN